MMYKKILQTGIGLFVVSFFASVHTLLNKDAGVLAAAGEKERQV